MGDGIDPRLASLSLVKEVAPSKGGSGSGSGARGGCITYSPAVLGRVVT
ncbi:Uncharacterised protein [Chlamydia abortus]|nr:Uncharacterised protein [Chlamydia abortus]SGA03597.1 Uncharacterised protein [Chlamydia abortus]SGA04580.1 Uncharacterised protein [Chlamydia abortus]SGA14891.1 Uncharacterised protein [Chlamydia abortus]SGA19552.1 Uncharacterised protein [Chlamydia abortus]